MNTTTEKQTIIVFCCKTCDKQIIRNSIDHDFSKCDESGEVWYCGDCPVPEKPTTKYERKYELDMKILGYSQYSNINTLNIHKELLEKTKTGK